MAETIKPIIPIYDPERGYREWLRSEIYTGPTGTGRFVPNIDDKVWDWDQGVFRVTDVDITTGLSILKAWAPVKEVPVDESDFLLGSGPGYTSEAYRALLDTSLIPHPLEIDGRLYCYRSNATYCKIFRGTDITPNGHVISKYYDASGNLLGENIPLELVAIENHTNYAIKSPKTAYTTEHLEDGETVTVVFYNDEGGRCSLAKLRITHSSFIRSVAAGERYITSVELVSPFRSTSDPSLIEFPINVDMGSVSMMAQVNYTDGKKVIAIDGNKCSLLGLDTYISTVLGQEVPLVLSYALGDGESCYDVINPNDKYITSSYRARTIATDGAYSVKLFPYPCWDETALEYTLHWYLYSLERETWYRVDNLIEADSTGPAYNPRKLGVTQQFAVAIDLSRVDGRFSKYRHVQMITLTLFTSGDREQTLWSVTHDVNHTFPYGIEVYASFAHLSGGNYRCNLAKEYDSADIWLERFYYDTFPVSNTGIEVRAPKPTHFVVEVNGFETEYPLAMWNQDFVVPTEVRKGQNIYLHWIRRDGTTDLHLGVSGVSVRYEDGTATLPA